MHTEKSKRPKVKYELGVTDKYGQHKPNEQALVIQENSHIKKMFSKEARLEKHQSCT